MNAAPSGAWRDRRLAALGVTRLRLRQTGRAGAAPAAPAPLPESPPLPTPPPSVPMAPPLRIQRLALQADAAERADPAIDKMYVALTEAVSKAGLQPVRVCDVAADAGAAVLVFGAADVPAGVPLLRVLRGDPLAVLHADSARKRRLWEQLLALGRGEAR